ncbi:MAG: hypothetical protein AAFX93_05810 [Verrucomicrobiota bacterium]
MIQNYRSRHSLPVGIREAVNYRLYPVFNNGSTELDFEFDHGLLLGRIHWIQSLSDWFHLIDEDDREHYLLNLEQAYEADYLISAYRVHINKNSEYWIIDYAECGMGDSDYIQGTILLAESIDDVARVMKKFVGK